MGVWDEIKDAISKFKPIEIKQEVVLHGDININYKGNNIHYSVSAEDRQRIGSTEVTPELEAEYERRAEEALRSKESYLESLPEDERSRLIGETTVASAIGILTRST
ncbi:MAG: hypothetical protein ACFFCW_40545 [Candidatus Hodarchaeota archaeon]